MTCSSLIRTLANKTHRSLPAAKAAFFSLISVGVFVCCWSVDGCWSETRTAVQGSIITQGMLSPASPISTLVGESCSSLPPQVSSAQTPAMERQGELGAARPWPIAQQGLRHGVQPSPAGGKWFWIPQNTHRPPASKAVCRYDTFS